MHRAIVSMSTAVRNHAGAIGVAAPAVIESVQ
jgi:hypothetical protein